MALTNFDYSEPAELYGGTPWVGRRAAMSYRRFDTAAEAIRYVVEELEGAGARSCVLEVDESRFNHRQIRKLYNCASYPLARGIAKEIHAS